MSDNLRPFAFEDLPLNDKGKRIEPEAWGPLYPAAKRPRNKSVSEWIRGLNKPGVTPGKSAENCRNGCASGQNGDFNAAKHRAKLKAEFTAAANAERRDWAAGKPRAGAYDKNETIIQAYERAMAAKQVQLEAAAKPHYVLRDGEWRLAA